MAGLLSSGRTSRLYQSLVEKQQVALSAEGFSGFPGNKYPNLMLFYALTAPGNSVDDVAIALREQIERLKTEPVSEAELERVKTQLKAALVRTLDSNMGMASLLAEYDAKTGSWRNVFEQLEAIAAVSAADIQTVARATFVPENRTVGRLLPSS
jgi:predicted Zn-dependent peptidase